ncbi:hypothetical protein [Kitasatospora viridis]|uniref:Uncharacterized protein n=1 Tax=Kitasatospora viridis TaxID=281105 RepID=A0A561UHB7_9ACTN|nr:hypothetical protein [Kitasatospora viridis]TWF98758.1 hypothetical protein FHX73_112580 [Kitasatospora viridis]
MGSQYQQNAGHLRLVAHRSPVPTVFDPAPPGPATRLPATPALPAGSQATAVAPVTVPSCHGGFAQTLHGAIEASGLSLDRIRTELAQQGVRVSVTTLSYWRRGRSQPERAASVRAVALLEDLLGLEERSLSSLLGPPRPRGRWVSQHTPDSLPITELWPENQQVAEVFQELDAPPIGELERLSIHDAYYVGAERQGQLLRTRQVVRATTNGVTRCLVVQKSDEDANGCPEITSVRHARLGRVRRNQQTGLLVSELLLDRPLGLGDSAVFEYEVELPPAGPTTLYARRFAVPVREFVLQVHFDPAALPAHCERYERDGGEERDRLRERLWIGASASVHALATEQQPGQTGIRWEWD